MYLARREFVRKLTAGSAASWSLRAAGAGAPPPRDSKPNIVIILCDQHRAGLTRRSGFPFDTMPALDRLADRGVSFEHAYTTAPLCVPARESLLTGRWPHAHRVRQNSTARFAVFERDLFQVLKSEGYRTGLTGKNHSHLTQDRLDFWRPYTEREGWKPDNAPAEFREFDQWLTHLDFTVAKEPTPFGTQVQFPYRMVSDAIDFVESAGSQPFALWISFPVPHDPYQVPSPYFDMFPPAALPAREAGPETLELKGFKWQWLARLANRWNPGYDLEWRRTRSNYLGMLRMIDDQIDRFERFLDRSGRIQDTILVYLTDHGDYFCDYGLLRKGVGLPEDLTRIPMIWAGWRIVPQTNHPAFVSTADIMPTLCEAVSAPTPRGVQGRSLWPLLRHESYPAAEFESIYSEVGFGGLNYSAGDRIDPEWGHFPSPPGAIPTFDELNPVTQSGNLKMIRQGDWKLTFDMMGNAELYNIARDPYELKNRYSDPAAAVIRAGLTEQLLRWVIRTQDDLPQGAYPAKWAARNWYANYL